MIEEQRMIPKLLFTAEKQESLKVFKSLFEAGEADVANWNMIYAGNYKSDTVALGMLLKFYNAFLPI